MAAVWGCAPTGASDFDFDSDGAADRDDCGPADAAVFPGADDPYGDQLDQDCDGGDGVDADGDGYPANLDAPDGLRDCDDGDDAVHPGAAEIPDNGVDEDCDTLDYVDDDADGTRDDQDCDPSDPGLNARDDDGDGSTTCDGDCDDGDPAVEAHDLDDDGWSTCGGDCRDDLPDFHPEALEVCDGDDGDCDGVTPPSELDGDGDGFSVCEGDCDDGDGDVQPADADGDGYHLCSPEPDCDDDDPDLNPGDVDFDGVSSCAGDCDEGDPGVHPDAGEACDGLDSDCDGLIPPDEVDGDGDGALACGDCDDEDGSVLGIDGDGDGFDPCTGDCNEGSPVVSPAAPDPWGDGVDQDCDGVDGVDDDGDGFPGNAAPPTLETAAWDCDDGDPDANRADGDGDGVDTCAGDCDDDDDTRFPANPDLACDGLDSDCAPDAAEVDDDGDGFMDCEGDCDDADPTLDLADADGDGADTCAGDCDDDDATSFPAAPDAWGDGLDTNCDGADGVDADGDGYSANAPGDDPAWDCDDTAAAAYPGAPEWNLCDGLDADCVPDPGEQDLDGDGSLPCAGDCDDDDPTLSAADLDGDGTSSCDGDCDDGDPGIGPASGWDDPGDAIDSDCAGGTATALDRAAHLRLLGEFGGDNSGRSTCGVGDVDGDGLADILVGAMSTDFAGSSSGAAYLLLAPTLADPGTVSLAAADGVIIGDSSNDMVGNAVGAAGDVDGDGLADFLVGARGWDGLAGDEGGVGLFFGAGMGGGTIVLSSADVLFEGEEDDLLGFGFDGGADLDGDGLDDLLLSAINNSEADFHAGKVYLVLGSTVGPTTGVVDLGAGGAHAELLGEESGDQAGRAVRWAGDVDGDGVPEALIGAYSNDEVASSSGKAYLVWGSDLLAGGTIDLGDAGASIVGDDTFHKVGVSFAALGDIDGDGLDDVAVGANGWDGSRGQVGIFYGSTLSVGGAFSLSDADTALLGEAAGDRTGEFLDAPGDVDGDGLPDLLVSAHRNDDLAGAAGKSYLVYGPTLGAGGSLDIAAVGEAFVPEAEADNSGMGLCGAGDVDGDGRPDLLVGAPSNDEVGDASGKTYLLLSPF